ncbi:MAG: LPS export ABC transporter periplasmic protein LptC [Candidatus Omnitrophota bacterium]|jgi:LPS export ABC transporter protein LptC
MIPKFVPIWGLVLFAAFAPNVLASETKAPQQGDQQIMDFSLSGFGEKGKKNWDLSGKSADIVTDDVKMKDVVGNLYGEAENIRLTADKGSYNKSDGNVELQENVLISTSTGAKMTTDSLNWDRKNQLVTTKAPVNIERDNIIASALGAIGQPNLNRVSLKKDVQVEINQSVRSPEVPQKAAVKNKIMVTCDGSLEIDYQRNIATFSDNVKVETADGSIYSDVMEVYFIKSENQEEPKAVKADLPAGAMTSQVDIIKAYGNVTIVRGDNISNSDEAVYSASDNKITLSGKPKLVIYSEGRLESALSKK